MVLVAAGSLQGNCIDFFSGSLQHASISDRQMVCLIPWRNLVMILIYLKSTFTSLGRRCPDPVIKSLALHEAC